MRFVGAKHVLVTVTAMLSLFVSAVSACACSHHEPVQKAVESSCHGPSHEAPAAEQPDLRTTHFESDCKCFVQTFNPAIVANKDERRVSADQHVDSVLQVFVYVPVATYPARENRPLFQPPQFPDQHALLASLPSRAPPSL